MAPSEHPEPGRSTPDPGHESPPPLPTNPFAAPESPLSSSGGREVGGKLADEQELAGRVSRFIAQTLDNLIGLGVALLAMIPLGLLGVLGSIREVDDAMAAFGGMAAIGAVVLVTLIFTGVQAYLLSTRGQTLGKMILNVRIVKTNGEKAGFLGAVFLRLIVSSLLFGGVAVFAMFALGDEAGIVGNLASTVDAVFIFRTDRRCVHDLIAGTKVVKV